MNGYVSRGDRCETKHRCGQAASDQGGKSELLHFDAFFFSVRFGRFGPLRAGLTE
jgi:hypothetical protein